MQNTWLCQTRLERLCFVVTSCVYLGFELSTAPVFGDNNGSLALSANPGGEHQRSKHIDVRYHYIRQQIEEKLLVALKAGTKYQLADFDKLNMTKATWLCPSLCFWSSSLWESILEMKQIPRTSTRWSEKVWRRLIEATGIIHSKWFKN